MTPKHENFGEKKNKTKQNKTKQNKTSDIFCKKVFGKIFWLIFKTFQLKSLDCGQKNGWFYMILEKLE